MKVYIIAFLVSVIAFVEGLPVLEDIETEWYKFKDSDGKVYKNRLEEDFRKSVFTENYKIIKEHNERYRQGTVYHFLNINRFADMTSQERKIALKGFKKSNESKIDTGTFVPDPDKEIPDSFDWRTRNAISEVKNQDACGSCWAFSATGALETQYFLKTGIMANLSEQNLVDCSHESGNSGCDGGDLLPAFTHIWSNDGIDSEEGYPYKAVDQKCQYDVAYNVTSVRGYSVIKNGSEDDLKAAVAQVGAIAVAIDASHSDFDFYSGGIYFNSNCDDGSIDPVKNLDHNVLVVGYGTEDGKDYWIVKNSWSKQWGEDGYIKMSRNRDNNCGIAAHASFPLMY